IKNLISRKKKSKFSIQSSSHLVRKIQRHKKKKKKSGERSKKNIKIGTTLYHAWSNDRAKSMPFLGQSNSDYKLIIIIIIIIKNNNEYMDLPCLKVYSN
ncbi:hypothetical protein ACMBCN_00665, partial [Candidatus Liberibacter asiaticus]|nr:hypothetical protein [Candidatus Liberibacter asiaticus]